MDNGMITQKICFALKYGVFPVNLLDFLGTRQNFYADRAATATV